MMNTNKVKRKLDYDLYRHLRESGQPASKVFAAWQASRLRNDALFASESTGDTIIARLLPLAVALMVIASMSHEFTRKRPTIWITSPLGNTTRQLPLYTALRIVRKRKWRFAEVKPIKVKRGSTSQRLLTRLKIKPLSMIIKRAKRDNGFND